ncbi:unnamed protein product [Callosobruchus maculatus]|uniref:Uncharacterized protein n=1 Tax=Callosobruchus maculatus TaxID=64391 RepID=A0A653CV87_CALMS|nr:unnamed protein product [Callosobruchus maculatus]
MSHNFTSIFIFHKPLHLFVHLRNTIHVIWLIVRSIFSNCFTNHT